MSRYHLVSASLLGFPQRSHAVDIPAVMTPDTWFRGTQDGDLEPNAHGIVWLAPDRDTALSYGPSVVEVHLSPSAHIIDLRDLSNAVVQEFKDTASSSRERTVGYPISDADWASWADFGMLEGNTWAVALLLKGGIDGVVVADSRGSSAVPHDSLALLNLSAVSSE